ncbi:hypothetical protein DYI37_10410 [Fulvimarina endophytica]|uniref:Uncharacterized protein n=1 Tax=Fulvimarina endophytica TaxID=2293836 RepID=A0A371X2J8_9HYPH|nr:hypothetical protein [Fulvimarina endophytica]RFC63441.1 hypothetical protein DYI37_10410 [Fulvimarina endophytica]
MSAAAIGRARRGRRISARLTARRLGVRRIGAIAGFGLLDAVLCLATAYGALPVGPAILVHFGLAGLLFAYLLKTKAEGAIAALSAINLAVMAFAGTVVTLLQILVLSRAAAPASRAEWNRDARREGDDDATRLYEAIVQNQAYQGRKAPERFDRVMSEGSIADRQWVLAQIVRSDRTYPFALVEAGLKSRDIAVRASAAAVYARLREKTIDRQKASEAQKAGEAPRPKDRGA